MAACHVSAAPFVSLPDHVMHARWCDSSPP